MTISFAYHETLTMCLSHFPINPSSILLLSIIGLSTFVVLTISEYRVGYLYHNVLCLYSLWLPVTAGNSVQPGGSLPVHINWAAFGLHWPLAMENQEDFLYYKVFISHSWWKYIVICRSGHNLGLTMIRQSQGNVLYHFHVAFLHLNEE